MTRSNSRSCFRRPSKWWWIPALAVILAGCSPPPRADLDPPVYEKKVSQFGSRSWCGRKFRFVDINGDGRKDLAAEDDSGQNLKFFPQEPGKGFSENSVHTARIRGRGWFGYDLLPAPERGHAWIYGIGRDGIERVHWHEIEKPETVMEVPTVYREYQPDSIENLDFLVSEGNSHTALIVPDKKHLTVYQQDDAGRYARVGAIPVPGESVLPAYGIFWEPADSFGWVPLNNDRHLDWLGHDDYGRNAVYYLGGPRGFSSGQPIGFTAGRRSLLERDDIEFRDMNGDGLIDGMRSTVSADLLAPETLVEVFLASGGNEVFPEKPDIAYSFRGRLATVTDLDGDGSKELIVVHTQLPPPSLDAAARALLSRGMKTEMRILRFDGTVHPFGEKPMRLDSEKDWWQTGRVDFFDVDGDHRKEMFLREEEAIRVFQVRGSRFVEAGTIREALLSYRPIEDLNGDGWPEFCWWTENFKGIEVCWSRR